MNAPATFPIDEKLRKQISSRWQLPFYMGFKLPLGLFAGLRVDQLDTEKCLVSVPYGWRSQNPFRSIYFAAQSMAAEMSTGAIAMLATKSASKSVAMLITNMEAEFVKKANKRTTFTCTQGLEIFQSVEQAVQTGEPQKCTVETIGTMADGTIVSTFKFTWSFKARK